MREEKELQERMMKETIDSVVNQIKDTNNRYLLPIKLYRLTEITAIEHKNNIEKLEKK